MEIGPPEKPTTISERITWNESEGLVRFTLHNDTQKEGHVDNRIEEKDGQLYLTFTFDWQFTEGNESIAAEFKSNIGKVAPGAVAKTIEVVDGQQQQ